MAAFVLQFNFVYSLENAFFFVHKEKVDLDITETTISKIFLLIDTLN